MANKNNNDELADNLLDFSPKHLVKWELNNSGNIHLVIPRFSHPFLVKYLLPRLKRKSLNVKLDEFGTWVWQHIDGEKTVAQIGKELKGAFGERAEPLYPRLGMFINYLARRKFIQLEFNQKK